MPVTVTIPGIEKPVEFPDGMTQDEIQSASTKLYSQNAKSPTGGRPNSQGFFSSYNEQVNPVPVIKAAWQVVSHPIKEANAYGQQFASHPIDSAMGIVAPGGRQLWEEAKEAFARGDYGGGAAKALYSLVPFFGPALSKSGEQYASGNVMGGTGTLAGIGTNLAFPEATKAIGAKVSPVLKARAESMYRGVLKPSPKLSMADQGVVTNLGLEENILPTEAGENVAKGIARRRGETVGNLYSKASPERTIDAEAAAKDIEALGKERFAEPGSVNPVARRLRSEAEIPANLAESLRRFRELKGALGESGLRDLLGDANYDLIDGGYKITPQEAFDIKVAMQQKATQAKQGAYTTGVQNPERIEALQTGASSLGDQALEQIPGLAEANASYSEIKKFLPEIHRAATRIANNPTPGASLAGHLARGAVSGAIGYGFHNPVAGAAAYGVSEGVAMMLRNPLNRAKVAIALHNASNWTVPESYRILGLMNQASNEQEDHDGSVVATKDGTRVKKNPPASPRDQKAAEMIGGSRDPVVAAKGAAAKSGVSVSVRRDGKEPVSKTTGTRITLAKDAGPAEAVHEAEHAVASKGRGDEPPEGRNSKNYSSRMANALSMMRPLYASLREYRQ